MAPWAECPACAGEVILSDANGDQIAECRSCKRVWGSFRAGGGAPVVAEVEFRGAA